MKLTPEKAQEIVEEILGEGKGYTRYVSADFSSRKIGWAVKTDKSKIIVVTSKLYSTPPYERDKKQKTICTDKDGNLEQLKEWANKW